MIKKIKGHDGRPDRVELVIHLDRVWHGIKSYLSFCDYLVHVELD